VSVQRDAVDHERVAEQFDVLARVAEAMRPAEPEAVVEAAVDALCIVPSRVEPLEVRIVWRDRPEVLSAIQLAVGICGRAVEPHGDRAAAVVLGEAVVVVPAEGATASGVAVGPDASLWHEVHLAGVGGLTDSERAVARVQREGLFAVRCLDGLVLEVGALRDPSAVVPARR
jgi:hypothetical protein